MDHPFISIIIPCRNEENYILAFLESIDKQSFPKDKFEVFIGDGASEDDTVKLIQGYAEKSALDINVIDNPEKTVSFALNKMISKAKGDFIIRLDAHAEYPNNYFEKLIEVAINTGACNVGAQWETCPGDKSLQAKVIAKCTSHKFGVGNSAYRTKELEDEFLEVETVPYGCFPKELFGEIGVFDTDLTRNQDDEFNARIKKNKGKIILIPDLKIKYYARKNWKK